jgi:hypothetical protein
MGLVIGQEIGKHLVDTDFARIYPIGRKPALDQGPGAAADHRTGFRHRDSRQTFAGENDIQGRDKVARCIG